MMQGLTGKRMGELHLDDEEPEDLEEVHFTGETLNIVRNDIMDFLSREHKKLGYTNPLDTYNIVKNILDSGKLTTKIKGMR